MYGGTPRSSASCLRSARSFSNNASSQAISPMRCFAGSGGATGWVSVIFCRDLSAARPAVRQFDDVELVRVLEQQTEPHQFAADRAPLGARVFAADVVGGKRLWPNLRTFSVSAPVSTSTTCFRPTPKPLFSRMR